MKWIIFLNVLIWTFSSPAIAQKHTSDIITIPVVVHVLYNNTRQNISDDQIRSQLAVLNRDYRKKNADAANTPDAFKGFAADARIEFRLATTDPSGMPTNGITRKNTSEPSFGVDDKIKSALSGGTDGWNREQYLNIWVGNIIGGVLGYASSPGCSSGKDGVVIRYTVFGTTANIPPPYNKGRTAVHEIGHWLGLRHIWGDSPCGDDLIGDTPPQAGPTRGCPSGVQVTCSSGVTGNMYMNFMDFTNDDCTNMFTYGQVAKMQELFAGEGARHALLSSDKAAGASEELEDKAALTIERWQIYPNPAINEIRVSLSAGEEQYGQQIIIYNHLGKVAKKITITKKELLINLNGWKGGVYFISCGGVARKFLKLD